MRVSPKSHSTVGPHRAAGFSLIEVLIAMVILSIGVLGVTGLQLASKRNNQDSVQQTRAAALAQELVERMRANSASAGLSTYVLNSPDVVGMLDAEPSPACSEPDEICDPEQLALHDLWIWQQGLRGEEDSLADDRTPTGGLVNAQACVEGPGGGSGRYTVTIAWRGGVPLADDQSIDCGAEAIDDTTGERLYGETDQFRRTIVLPAFIAVR